MSALTRMLRGRKGSFIHPPFWSLTQPIFSGAPADREQIENNFESYVQGAYKRNGVVFAVMLVRQLVFSEARFLWRRIEDGRPTDLFEDERLALLERPWPNGTTGELLARMEQDTSLAGNFYATVVGSGNKRRIRRLRPDWVTIVTGSPSDDPFDLEAEPIAYVYEPRHSLGGARAKPQLLTPEQVVHWSPVPDPEAQWRGMSWLQPVVNEILADSAATKHKLAFFENGAVPGLAIVHDPSVSPETFDAVVAEFEKTRAVKGAYKTIHLAGGADIKTFGADMKQLDFKVTQGAGETRICAAGGVHPVIVGLSEGLQGSSLNAGNFNAARRSFADARIRPQWRSAASALEPLVGPPGERANLWYDDRDVPFLREDAKEEAEIRNTNASTLETLIRSGYTPDSAADAVTSGDFRKLSHSGLVSVQLHLPGEHAPDPSETGDDE